jgi:tetratricopeptide (TPR) repeat protein
MRWALVACLFLGWGSAHADDDPDTEFARKKFAEGTAAYGEADYPRALAAFEAARRARPAPAFDYNIGRCHDRMGSWAEAIAAYERWLASSPPEADAREIRDRVAALRERLKEPAPVTPVVKPAVPPQVAAPPVAPPPAPASRSRLVAPVVVGAVALAAGAAAIGLGVTVDADYRRLDGPEGCRPCAPSQWSGVEARAGAFYGILAIAGAAAIADVVLWIWAVRRPRERSVAAVRF